MTAAVIRWLSSRQADIAWKIMAAVALALSVTIGVRQYQMTQCQARYNEASNASQRARAQAAEADRQAQDAMFTAVAANPRGAIAAIRQYNQARAAADAQRASNPVPPPPSETCG